MKQLGNLAIICAKRPEVMMTVYDGRVTVHVGAGPDRASMHGACDSDREINRMIYELNFGKYAVKQSACGRNQKMMRHYYDKNGKEIHAGMTIRHGDGDIELVYKISDANGEEDLGIMATNPDYVKHHPNCNLKYYSLSSIGARNWEIVQ